MSKSWICTALFMVALTSAGGLAADGQTDVAASLYGAFNGSTNSNGTVSPSNAAGALLEVRHIKNPLAGFEVTYSYNRANQADSFTVSPPCPVGGTQPCGPTTTTAAISANAHEFTADWIASLKIGNLRPFALAGGGALFDVPTSNSVPAASTVCPATTSCTTTAASISTSAGTKGVIVYGAGIDWGLLPHLGLRLQYRGNLYKMPALLATLTSTKSFMQTAEPMIGVYFRF